MRKSPTLCLLFVVAIALSGCVTKAQREYNRIGSVIKAAGAEAKRCRLAARAKIESEEPALSRWMKARYLRIEDGMDPRAAEKFAITDHATSKEKRLLLRGRDLVTTCRKGLLTSGIPPQFVEVLSRRLAEQDKILSDVLSNKLTIGEANRTVSDNYYAGRAELNTAEQRIINTLSQSHQAQLAARRQAANALQAWAYQQQQLENQRQLIHAVNRPIITSCNYMGVFLRCRSY